MILMSLEDLQDKIDTIVDFINNIKDLIINFINVLPEEIKAPLLLILGILIALLIYRFLK